MSQTETLSPLSPKRQIHLNLENDRLNLENTPEEKTFSFVENQVMHYLSEHVLNINHPWLNKDDSGAYSYKLREITDSNGNRILMPVDYDNKTTFIDLCSNPYRILEQKVSNPDYQPTPQDLRVFDRTEAEMNGARRFEELITTAEDDSFVVWSSPPGNPDDGYWDLSMTFIAQVKTNNNPNNKEIRCYRYIHNLSLSQDIFFLNSLNWSQDKLDQSASTEDVVRQPIRLPVKTFNGNINKLIAYLYSLDGKQIDAEKAAKDLEKLEEIRKKIDPVIENLTANLIAGNTRQAETQLDKIEKQAMEIYFEPRQLYEIIYGKEVVEGLPFYASIDFNELLAAAHYYRRQEMTQKGTSCPSVDASGIDPITGQIKSFDPRQQLINHLENVISSESSTFECMRCHHQISGKPKKCPICGAQTCYDPEKRRK